MESTPKTSLLLVVFFSLHIYCLFILNLGSFDHPSSNYSEQTGTWFAILVGIILYINSLLFVTRYTCRSWFSKLGNIINRDLRSLILNRPRRLLKDCYQVLSYWWGHGVVTNDWQSYKGHIYGIGTFYSDVLSLPLWWGMRLLSLI